MTDELCVKQGDGIEKYIQIIKKLSNKNKITVFRGETTDHGETACQPNIFRDGYLDNNEFFEKNVLDEMTANHIAVGQSYLEKAINAQHGGFPSRLLDVSYNSLVALFFAVAPFYTKKITSTDEKNGYVYVFNIDEMFCPVGDGVTDNYDELICRKKSWYSESTLFNRNFKLIDHIKTNSRIIAQQGAFILFQGMDAQEIPKSLYTRIMIEGGSKKELREDLKQLFGIHMGTIYPEENNLVEVILDKSRMTNSKEFELKNELDLSLRSLERDLDDAMFNILKSEQVEQDVRELEELIFWYKSGFEKLQIALKGKESEVVKNFAVEFNVIVNKYYAYIEKYFSGQYLNRAETLIESF